MDKKTETAAEQEKQGKAVTQTPVMQAPILQPKGEIGGTQGQEPTIFGDWQHAGRCSDF